MCIDNRGGYLSEHRARLVVVKPIANPVPYSAYKDSGVEWLGEVPEHWKLAPNRALFKEIKDRGYPDELLLSVTIASGVIQQSDLLSDTSKKDSSNLDKSAYKLVQVGDIAYNKMRAWEGAIGLSQYRGIVSPAYIVQRPQNQMMGTFAHYLLRTPGFAKEAERWSYGITSDQWSLRPEHFKMIYSCVPPLPEQTAITHFLDYTDRRIQRYIRAKQKLITLLEEQKQAIIHQVVTGQIDVRTGQPYPAYKDSGVEWLGEVPEHWEVRKLRHCGTVSGGMTPSMEVRRFWGGPVPWVTPKDMKRAVISDSSVRVTDSALQETPLRLIEPPAVLIVVRGMILARRVPIAYTAAPVTINQDMKAFRTLKGTGAVFLARLLDSAQEAFMPLIDEAGHGTRRLPTERWREIVIAVPPVEEQANIVECLDNRTAAIDTTISHNQRQIDLLSEYRTRLISDVVTGKLDVRETAAALPEVDPLETEDSEETLEPTTELAEEFEAIAEGASA